MRIVLDTNILIGALITRHTPPDQLYQAWLEGQFDLITSRAQIDEFDTVVARPRLRRYITPDAAAVIRDHIDTRAIIIETLPEVRLSPDPKDNPILATAIAGHAELIVSGDKNHLLALGQVQGIPVVTARKALLLIP